MNQPVLATTTPNPSAPAGGAAQILQPDPRLFKSRLYPSKNTHNSLISAGGAGQIPQATAINDKTQSFLAFGNHLTSDHAGGAAQIPRDAAINVGPHDNVNGKHIDKGNSDNQHSSSVNPQPLEEGAGPYSTFDLTFDQHHANMESEKLARRLVMVPIDKLIDDEEVT